MKLVSLFTGAGGLDLGFHNVGFETIWCNECDSTIHETIEYNFPNIELNKNKIEKIPLDNIPKNVDGIIGGPPCQSWSCAGNRKGIQDPRGKLFLNYVQILNYIKPLFFLAENVNGILMERNKEAFTNILEGMEKSGYNVAYKVLSAMDYGVAQDRKRIFLIGFHKKLRKTFKFPEPFSYKVSLKDAIWDLQEGAIPARTNWIDHDNQSYIPNHEYSTERFSNFYLMSNRVRAWHEPSYTVRAAGRNVPCHPSAPKMILASKDTKSKMMLVPNSEHLYRRLTVRECARIQSFPDTFIFKYKNIINGYKMVGNAVPVKLAEILAHTIMQQI